MTTYRIKPEYQEKWGNVCDDSTRVTNEDIASLSRTWDVPTEQLLEQLEEVSPVSHTPGPWRADKAPHTWPGSCWPSYYIRGDLNAECEGEPDPKSVAVTSVLLGAEGEANARLIAAAPDLLEACKMAVSSITGGSCFPEYFGDVDQDPSPLLAAIAKATGETP